MANKNKDIKLACRVCGGKGGWKKTNIQSWLDENWQDCLYCEGYGFVEKKKEEDMSFLLAYNGYKKIIVDLMEDLGEVVSYTTKDRASTIEIGFIPKDRNIFADFAKRLLKFGHYSSRMNTEILQVFFYEPSENRHNYYWKIVLNPSNIEDLDGYVDFLRDWKDATRGRMVNRRNG